MHQRFAVTVTAFTFIAVSIAVSVVIAGEPATKPSTLPAATKPSLQPDNRLEVPRLHLAIAAGKEAQAMELLRAGADVNARDRKGSVPLYYAVTGITGSLVMAKELVDRGAEVNALCIGGFTPLHNACHWGQPKAVEFLLEKGANVHARDATRGSTPLHIVSVDQGHKAAAVAIAEAMLKQGANVNLPNKLGQTPLDIARESGTPEIAALLVKWGGKPGYAAEQPAKK